MLLKGNKLNVKVKNRKNSDCKFIGYVIEELKVKGWFEFCFVIDFFKFRLILILLLKKD